jgi:glycosyltransferase involved in cell wall biosynthesis
VSVVIPVYNGERFVRAAIESVLSQDFTDLECIVVDDGSTDGTAAVLAAVDDQRLRCVRNPNQGTSGARNAGIDLARGELVALLDADDVWLPGKLTAQVAVLDGDADLGFVTCGYTITDEALRALTEIVLDGSNEDVRRWLMLEGNGVGFGSTAVIRASALAEAGVFEPRLSTSADVDLAVRIARRRRVTGIRRSYVLYRTHAGQIHLDLDLFERDCTLVLHRQLADDPGAWRRGTANLHTRLAAYHLRARDGRWRHHLAVSLSHRPDRVLRLPLEALVRRLRRRLVVRRSRRHARG